MQPPSASPNPLSPGTRNAGRRASPRQRQGRRLGAALARVRHRLLSTAAPSMTPSEERLVDWPGPQPFAPMRSPAASRGAIPSSASATSRSGIRTHDFAPRPTSARQRPRRPRRPGRRTSAGTTVSRCRQRTAHKCPCSCLTFSAPDCRRREPGPAPSQGHDGRLAALDNVALQLRLSPGQPRCQTRQRARLSAARRHEPKAPASPAPCPASGRGHPHQARHERAGNRDHPGARADACPRARLSPGAGRNTCASDLARAGHGRQWIARSANAVPPPAADATARAPALPRFRMCAS